MKRIVSYGDGKVRNYSINVDPGVVTSGFTLIDKKDVKVIFASYRSNQKVMKKGFGEFYLVIEDTYKSYIDLIDKFKKDFKIKSNEEIEVNIESPFFGKIFSIGLIAFLSLVLNYLRREGFGAVNLISAGVGKFFLQTRTTPKKAIRQLVKKHFPFVKDNRLDSHVLDSLLIAYVADSTFFKDKFNVRGLRSVENVFERTVLTSVESRKKMRYFEGVLINEKKRRGKKGSRT